tara:strand:- start:771 stop:1505 length:735 start_codon:yes stop_codon:yes gene_type:complete
MKDKIDKIKQIWRTVRTMPSVEVNLMKDACEGNDPYFARITEQFYREANARHPKFPLIRKKTYGIALFPLDGKPDSYLKAVESSARRNYKKAIRKEYTFRRINFNDYLDDIWDIRRSAKVRQGEMPEGFINNRPSEVCVPLSNSNVHDYPCFGVFNQNGKLVAYANCIVAGELIEVEHVYGHSEFQSDGIVPLLYISIGEVAVTEFPHVKYYSYGTFLGASPTMQRFKKKFKFLPHKVLWKLHS